MFGMKREFFTVGLGNCALAREKRDFTPFISIKAGRGGGTIANAFSFQKCPLFEGEKLSKTSFSIEPQALEALPSIA